MSYKFEVGQKVTVFKRGNISGFGTVERVTPTGMAQVDNNLYLATGFQRGDDWVRIKPTEQAHIDTVEKNDLVRFMCNRNFEFYDLETLRKLKEIIDAHKKDNQK